MMSLSESQGMYYDLYARLQLMKDLKRRGFQLSFSFEDGLLTMTIKRLARFSIMY